MLTEDYITEVYCFIDDMMKECWKNIRKRGPGPKLSDAEVITMEIAGESLGMDCDKTIHRYFRDHWRHLFPNLGTRTTENPELKGQCRTNFKLFCESYFPANFSLEWSTDHLKVIAKIETAVLHGGLFAMAMPRGSGKSTLTEGAALWSMLYGHREFVFLVGATEAAALEMLDSIKTELETNEHLLADFPEVSFPIAALDGIANRCAGQLYKGERTRITWTSNEIVLPTIADSPASGVTALFQIPNVDRAVTGISSSKPSSIPLHPPILHRWSG